MLRKKGFTLIELLVVISIIALLVSILMPALGKARKQAKKTVCLSNVRSFAMAFTVYAASNEDRIVPLYLRAEGKFWTEILQDWYEADDLRLCPEAEQLKSPETEFAHENLGIGNYGEPFKAWYHYHTNGPNEGVIYPGSYGTNGWVHKGEGQTWGFAYENHWGKMGVKNSTDIPLMMDCTWVAGYPLDTDNPLTTAYYYQYWTGAYGFGQMNRYCFDRHNGAVNSSFLDGSARTVPLPDLWTLKWHRSYNPVYDIEIEWIK